MTELQSIIVFHGDHKRGIHTGTHTHITIALGEMQHIAFRLKSKEYCDDLAINGFERGFKEGTRFILDTYIYFRYPCNKITQTNIYSQLARISFLCTIIFFFYLLDNRFA